MSRSAAHVLHLGVKELRELLRDPFLLVLLVYSFTVAVHVAGTAVPETLHRAPVAIVDHDGSTLSGRIAEAFLPPHFLAARVVTPDEAERGLDEGEFTFVLDLPPDLARDTLAGRSPAIGLDVDATRMSQAFAGAGAVGRIVLDEVEGYAARERATPAAAVGLDLRMRFNPNLDHAWFGSVMETVNMVTLVSVVLAGAALIREREHGTLEHLLTLPVTPAEVVLAKVWSMGLVTLGGAAFAATVVLGPTLGVPIAGSVLLWLAATATHLAATTALGIFLATLARSMPQFGLLLVLVLMPLEMLSGGMTPRESMPAAVRTLMSLSPTTHFTATSQAILFRGAGFAETWPGFLAMAAIGATLLGLSLVRFRGTVGRFG